MTDPSEKLLDAMSLLESLAREVTPEEAVDEIDAATLQSFWREWPHTVGWAGALWRRLNQDLDTPSQPGDGSGYDETGGSG